MNVADVLMVGLPGPRVGPAERAWLERLEPAGVVLFARNVDTPSALVELGAQLRRLRRPPVLVAIDQEGGRVARLAGWTGPTPTAHDWSRRRPEQLAAYGRATGRSLAALGINLDFAPVVDLSPPDAANGIGDRAFGTRADDVIRFAGAFLDGLQAEQVAGCLKHFPGLGATTVDSHERLPIDPRGADELDADLRPFRRLAPRAAAVMVGHAHYPALDEQAGRPASLSPRIAGELLRGRLAYDGLVVTDDLEMGAIATRDPDGAAAVDAVRAGCDLLLYCADPARAESAAARLEREVADDRAFACALERAAAAVRRAAARHPLTAASERAWVAALDALRASAALA